MSEIEDLLEIYGAIDRAAVLDPTVADAVAPLLGPYQDRAAIGWFDKIADRTGFRSTAAVADEEPAKGEPPAEDGPTLAEADGPPAEALSLDTRRMLLEPALEAMRRLAETEPRGRTAAHRLLAVAAAMRAFPEELGPTGTDADVVRRALSLKGIIGAENEGDAGEERALRLQERLIPSDAPNAWVEMDDWEGMINGAADDELIPLSLAMQAEAKPCSGRLVMVRVDGDDDPVSALSTEFFTDKITFAEATMYLEPVNWPHCSDFWCLMELQPRTSPAGNPIYHEIVSTDCQHKDTALFTAETELEFTFLSTPTKATAAYNLPADLSSQYTDIEVDQGSLSVEQMASGAIRVCSTKRVRFSGPLDGAALSMLSCATGYGAAGEHLVFNCAALKGTSGGTPFKGTQPPGGTMPPKKAATTKKATDPSSMKTAATVPPSTASATASVSPELDTATKDAVAVVQKCVADTTAAYQASYAKVTAGKYTVDDWFKDVTMMWSVAVRDASTLMNLGVQAAQSMAQSAGTTATGKPTAKATKATGKST